jgi:hypothetical protein
MTDETPFELCALKFIRKYQLVPRPFRLNFLDKVRNASPRYEKEDLFENLISTLIGYENSHNDDDFDYDDLWEMLGSSTLYYYVANCLLSYLHNKSIIHNEINKGKIQ